MIHWKNDLLRHLNALRRRMPQHLAKSIEPIAQGTVAFAKAQAPWTDRTGAARRGLYSDVSVQGSRVVVETGHGVPYGKDLEARGLGILEPALHYQRERITKDATIFK